MSNTAADLPALPWYMVSNEDGVVLAVYGAALGDEAKAKATAIVQKHKCPVAIHYVWMEKRPYVGLSISMRGNLEWVLP